MKITMLLSFNSPMLPTTLRNNPKLLYLMMPLKKPKKPKKPLLKENKKLPLL